jgi:hypothetical protein
MSNNVLYYCFQFPLEYAKAIRISEEKVQQETYAIYSHHSDPMRDQLDMIGVKLFIRHPDRVAQQEADIIARCMNAALREFDWRVRDELDKYKQEVEARKKNKEDKNEVSS